MKQEKTNYIYVLDKNGKPLMPTSRAGKVRHMLKRKEAVVVCRDPFTNRRLTLVTLVMRYRRHFFVCRKQRIFSYYIIQAEKGDVRIMHTLRHVRTKH